MADLKAQLELTTDASGVEAGFSKAKRSINSFGATVNKAGSSASNSIDKYVKRLEVQNKTLGMSTRQSELYKLGLRGATEAQLKAADATLRLNEAYKRGAAIGDRMKGGMIAAAAGATLAAGGIAALVISSINAADRLSKLSKTTGVTVEELSGLSFAANQSGSDLEGIAKSVGELSKRMGKDGERFRALGISAKDPIEALKQLSDIFSKIEDPQTRAALGSEALGKSWESAAPLLSEGGKRIGEMIEKGKKLSGVTTEMAEESAKFNDELDELKAAAQGVGTKLANDMLPAFNDIIKVVKTAYEESGKLSALWVSMGALGAFLFTDEFSSATVKIKNLQGELKSLEDNKSRLKGGGYLDQFLFGTADEIDKKIANVKAQIAALQKPVGATKPNDPNAAAAAAKKAKEEAKAAAEAERKAKEFIENQKKNGAQVAGARLGFDIDQIKKASDAIVGTYSNAEKIMQANRAAGLVNEREYYAAKLGLLRLTGSAQEAALSEEIKRLQKEKLSGKEKIDNDRKISDAQEKLAKVRADTVANIEVLAIQEIGANKKIADSYLDAQEAAQAYLDTVRRQNAREVAGIGRGEEFRRNQEGRNEIEDKQTTARQGLESDLRRGDITREEFDRYLQIVNDTYAKEVELYNARTIAIKEAQADWLNGATEAFANFQSNAEDVAGNTAAMFTEAFEGMTEGVSSSIAGALVQGENFGESMKNVALGIAESFIASFIKIQIQKMFLDKTAASAYAGTIAAQSQAMAAMAGLNAFASTAAIPIVGPAMAPAAGAAALAIAEGFAATATTFAAMSIASARGGFDIPAGVNPLTQLHEKEMVLPAPQAEVIRDLAKDKANGGTPGSSPVTIINNTSAKIGKVTERTFANGERALTIEEVEDVVAAGFGDPNSRISRSMSRNLNIARSR